MMYGSPIESQSVAYATQDVRMAFVRKVYGLFFASVLTTIVTSWISMQQGIVEVAWGLHLPLWIISFLMILAMSWGKQKSGINLVLLYAYAAIIGVVLGPVFYLYEASAPGITLEAGSLAATVMGGLTAYVMVTKQDFNWLGGFLFCALISLILAGLFLCVFHIAAMSTLYCIAGVLIFSGFVLYDTSRILTRMTLDQAPIAALELYLDFWNLVLFILRLLGRRR